MAPSGYATQSVRPQSQPLTRTSVIHFHVHAGMVELRQYADQRGWLRQGFTQLSVPWVELVYTTDGWATTRRLKSTDVPSPVVNGQFFLPEVAPGTEVEFAVHVGVSCHAPFDTAGVREHGELWLNSYGQNYRQLSR